MPPSLRPLLVACLITVLAAPLAAKTKSKKIVTPLPISACVDFYASSNADWLRNYPLPAGTASHSRWDDLYDLAARQTAELVASTQAGSPGTASALLADLVASGSNEPAIETAGPQALQPLLAQIDGMRKPADIARVVAALHAQGLPVMFDFAVVRDAENGQPRARFLPAGLGLVDPRFYGATDAPLQHVNDLYRAYVAELLKASGVPEAKLAEQTGWVMAAEAGLAKASAGGTAIQVSLKQAGKTYKSLAIGNFLQAQGVATDDVQLVQPDFFAALNQRLSKTPVAQWQAYLRAQVVHSLAPYLGQEVRNPHAQLFDVLLPGRLTTPTLAENVSALVTGEGADLLSAAYAERIPGAQKQQSAEAIAESIRAALGRAIDRAAWLSPDSKTAGHAQLSAMQLAIGRPVIAVSFADLHFQRGQLAGNVLALRRWQHARAMARMASPTWPSPASQTHPLIGFEAPQNRLIVTAAALQSPVFDGQAGAADYGAFGALLAQQMSQDVRRLKGADANAWAARSASLIAQYDAYLATGSSHFSGARTVAQNAADLTGLEIAWDALNAKGPLDDTGKKAFFSAWAHVWARQDSDAGLRAMLDNSEFAPAKWRVNGPLSNLPAFAQTYDCKAGQPMFRPGSEQVALWR